MTRTFLVACDIEPTTDVDDLAAEWMGWQNIFQVEIEEYCQRLLAQNFPNVGSITDV